MITVTIKINESTLYHRTANRVGDGMKSNNYHNTYEVDTGDKIKHKGEDGAVKLAIKMLKTIKELKER